MSDYIIAVTPDQYQFGPVYLRLSNDPMKWGEWCSRLKEATPMPKSRAIAARLRLWAFRYDMPHPPGDLGLPGHGGFLVLLTEEQARQYDMGRLT